MHCESVNHLLCSPAGYSHYKGHLHLSNFELTGEDATRTTVTHLPRTDISNWSARQCSDWLRGRNILNDSETSSLRLLMVCTQNQFTKRGASPRWPRVSISESRGQEESEDAKFIRAIFEETQLPLAGFAAYIKTLLTFARVPEQVEKLATGDNGAKYYCSTPSWAVVWSFDNDRRSVFGVLFYREGDGEERAEEVIREVNRLRAKIDHPMLLAYISTKNSLSRILDWLHDMNFETLKLVQQTGLPTWHWALERELPPHGPRGAGEDTVDRFNALSGKVTNLRFRLRTIREQIRFIVRCNSQHQKVAPPESLSKCIELDDMMQTFMDLTNVHLHDLDARSERLKNQMTSVAQLAAQQDARINIALARDNRLMTTRSQRDNSSMRTIAIVSLFFLPATFVASFFAMPIIDWSADSQSPTVSKSFWIYWVVSLPLTCMIVVGWLVWHKKQERFEKESEDKAQTDLEKQIQVRHVRKAGGAKEKVQSARKKGRSWLLAAGRKLKFTDDERKTSLVDGVKISPVVSPDAGLLNSRTGSSSSSDVEKLNDKKVE